MDASGPYATREFPEKLNSHQVKKEIQNIEMMMHSKTSNRNVFKVEIKDISEVFQFRTKVIKVKRETLLLFPKAS